MAQAPRSPDGNDNFIRHVVTDPKNVPDVMVLTGYLGDSSEEGYDRLYDSVDCSRWAEIPKTAILHQAPLPKEQDAHGGVTVWVKKDAALQYKMAPAAQALANYFAGAIQAGAQGAPGVAARPHVTIGACGHVTQHCPTVNCSLHCATEITPCINTHANTCYCPVTHGCATQNQLCQSQGACTYVGCGASLACTQGLLCGGAAAAAVRAPPRSVGGCGQSVGADCTAADLCTINECPSQFATCMPVQTCMPNVCTVDSVCCQTAFAVCPPTPVNPCVSAGATCANNCTQGFVCRVSHLELACQFTVNPRACQFAPVASGVACPQVSLACPQQSLACGGFPGRQGLGGQGVQPQGFEWSVMCTIRCWHTGRACWV